MAHLKEILSREKVDAAALEIMMLKCRGASNSGGYTSFDSMAKGDMESEANGEMASIRLAEKVVIIPIKGNCRCTRACICTAVSSLMT